MAHRRRSGVATPSLRGSRRSMIGWIGVSCDDIDEIYGGGS